MDLPGSTGFRGELGLSGDLGTSCAFFFKSKYTKCNKCNNLGLIVYRTKRIERGIRGKGDTWF